MLCYSLGSFTICAWIPKWYCFLILNVCIKAPMLALLGLASLTAVWCTPCPIEFHCTDLFTHCTAGGHWLPPFAVVGLERRALHMPGKCFTTDLSPQWSSVNTIELLPCGHRCMSLAHTRWVLKRGMGYRMLHPTSPGYAVPKQWSQLPRQQ